MSPKTKSKTDLYSSRHETWGRPCLQVVNSALTKHEAMIHNEQARNNILIPSLSQSTDSFKELVSTLLLSLYEVRPHTGLLATYQLSRRLNMINLPTQLIWDELTRKNGYPTHYWRETCKQRFSESKSKLHKISTNQQLIDVVLNLSDYKFGQEHKRRYEKRLLF